MKAQDISDLKTKEPVLTNSTMSLGINVKEFFLKNLQEAATQALPSSRAALLERLNVVEKEVQDFVDGHNFIDGAWYRPIHNVIVPLAMLAICKECSASRDLLLAAQLHDIGYAGIRIPGTLQGAKWESKDSRETHMAASREMSEKFLDKMISEGKIPVSEERKQKLLEIIATHDNPYIGIALTDPEALLHRDADRAFVISFVSFWKDYLAYCSDPKVTFNFAEANVDLTPETFIKIRRAGFLGGEDKLRTMINEAVYEPMNTETGLRIFDGMYNRRLNETPLIMEALAAGDSKKLQDLFRRFIDSDIAALIE